MSDQRKTKELTTEKQKACSFKAKYWSINTHSTVKAKEVKDKQMKCTKWIICITEKHQICENTFIRVPQG